MYKIEYLTSVRSDILNLPKTIKKRLQKAIEEKLKNIHYTLASPCVTV